MSGRAAHVTDKRRMLRAWFAGGDPEEGAFRSLVGESPAVPLPPPGTMAAPHW